MSLMDKLEATLDKETAQSLGLSTSPLNLRGEKIDEFIARIPDTVSRDELLFRGASLDGLFDYGWMNISEVLSVLDDVRGLDDRGYPLDFIRDYSEEESLTEMASSDIYYFDLDDDKLYGTGSIQERIGYWSIRQHYNEEIASIPSRYHQFIDFARLGEEILSTNVKLVNERWLISQA